jgi:hypothetical protein
VISKPVGLTVDFLACEPHWVDHLAPVWLALEPDERGAFLTTEKLFAHAVKRGVVPTKWSGDISRSGEPICINASGPLTEADRTHTRRRIAFFEHGAGFTFGNMHSSYCGSPLYRGQVSLFCNPNRYVDAANLRAFPRTAHEIIGCPKMDKFHNAPARPMGDKPVICVSFHWECMAAPETRSAWREFKDALPGLMKEFTVVGHGHPRMIEKIAPEYEKMGIPVIRDFEEVIARADVYVNDSSSTLYEFASLNRPVVVLNASTYRRKSNLGLRFWEHSDVGVNCDRAVDLVDCVKRAIEDLPEQQVKRVEATMDVYPHMGHAAETAANALRNHIMAKKVVTVAKPLEQVPIGVPKLVHKPESDWGVVYIAFGNAASKACRGSIISLRRTNPGLDIAVVGDDVGAGTQSIELSGVRVFNKVMPTHYRFIAGEVKPRLYMLSPFERTLYLDADTTVCGDLYEGFRKLDDYDLMLAPHDHALTWYKDRGYMRSGRGAGELEQTIRELPMKGDERYWNTGVMFWKRSPAAEAFFMQWHKEWKRYPAWDEQLAAMRAVHAVDDIKWKELPRAWNAKYPINDVVIKHTWGRGVAVRQ